MGRWVKSAKRFELKYYWSQHIINCG